MRPAAPRVLVAFRGRGNDRQGFQRGLGFYVHVHDRLRKDFQAAHQLVERAAQRQEARHFQSGEQTVAGRGVIEKNDVAGLFAAEVPAAAQHFLEHVAVPDGNAREAQAFFLERALKAQVGHGRADHAATAQLPGGFQISRDGQQHAVAVHVQPAAAHEHGAVGVAVKGHAQRRAGLPALSRAASPDAASRSRH